MRSSRIILKLALAFGALIIILLGVGWLGLSRMAKMNGQIQQIVDRRWHKVQLSREALRYSSLNSRITMQIFLMDDPKEVDPLLELRAENTEKISELLKTLEAEIESEDEKALLSAIWTNRTPYRLSYQRALNLLLHEGQPEAGRLMMAKTVLPNLVAYHKAYDAFVELQAQQMDKAGNVAKAHYTSARQLVIGLVALAAALAGAIAWFVTRGMTKEIQNRLSAEEQLREAHDALEVRVEERTAELSKANEELHSEIRERKQAEGVLERTHQQLLEASRLAGRAEVATGVLHNVGNVLNSANVTATLVIDEIRKSHLSDLARVVGLLEEHRSDLGAFLTQDPKGQKVPAFLVRLTEQLSQEQAHHLGELDSLRQNLNHIKEIISVQQSYAKTSDLIEPVAASTLLEDALRMNATALARHDIQVLRDYADLPPLTIDKHKALQILVNLVRNAKQACDESGRADQRLTLRVTQARSASEAGLPPASAAGVPAAIAAAAGRRDACPTTSGGEDRILISIIDNGVGISAENLGRIFNHGFTTKKDGHGFGLHSSALAAAEMGGSLSVHSDGPGQGAVFTLELPVYPPHDCTEQPIQTMDQAA